MQREHGDRGAGPPLDRSAWRLALERSRTPPRDGEIVGAAVAAVFREIDGDAELLLIRRAERPGDPWSGHMAFPGGRVEPADLDPLATAIRETREEVGLDLERHGELLGPLAQLQAWARGRPAGLYVAPYVFAVARHATLDLSPSDEVARVVWARLSELHDPAAQTTLPYLIGGQQVELPAVRVGDDLVWGLTHRMLMDLFGRLSA